jgi:hypothetical protein
MIPPPNQQKFKYQNARKHENHNQNQELYVYIYIYIYILHIHFITKKTIQQKRSVLDDVDLDPIENSTLLYLGKKESI